LYEIDWVFYGLGLCLFLYVVVFIGILFGEFYFSWFSLLLLGDVLYMYWVIDDVLGYVYLLVNLFVGVIICGG